jgi:hypothetical protein
MAAVAPATVSTWLDSAATNDSLPNVRLKVADVVLLFGVAVENIFSTLEELPMPHTATPPSEIGNVVETVVVVPVISPSVPVGAVELYPVISQAAMLPLCVAAVVL